MEAVLLILGGLALRAYARRSSDEAQAGYLQLVAERLDAERSRLQSELDALLSEHPELDPDADQKPQRRTNPKRRVETSI